jgi:hypothetical protein
MAEPLEDLPKADGRAGDISDNLDRLQFPEARGQRPSGVLHFNTFAEGLGGICFPFVNHICATLIARRGWRPARRA